MVTGTFSTLLLIWLSPTIQVDVLKHAAAWFPLKNPALVTIPLSFGVGILASMLWPEPAAEARYRALARQMQLGHEAPQPGPPAERLSEKEDRPS